MSELIPLFFGLFIGLVVDIIWWVKPTLSKADKFKAHEHYHVALEFAILSMIVYHFTSLEPLSNLLLGIGFAFLLGEWDQLKEIVIKKTGKTVEPGHPFAYGSSHFKGSTIIGLVLGSIAVISYFYLPVILS